MNFAELGLPQDLLQAVEKLGFETPTDVQAKVIPHLLENDGDLVALAQTGTGKTAAFGLPILARLDHAECRPQALILAPTRELCVQIARDIKHYAAYSPKVRTVAIYGGTPIQPQLVALRRGVHLIVATPGRMLDVLRRGAADLQGIRRVILDEADEMLNMGFQEDLEAILEKVPDEAHTLLFSATMPRQVASIAKQYMTDAKEITIGERNAGAENVTHECYVVHQRDRYRALKRIADFYPDMYAIVFCRTRQDTQSVADWLIRDGYDADALHGDLTQAQRDRVMDKFRSKAIQILVATDVAARGLDVTELTHVVNYTLPDELSSYTHRSGRTGRAGKSGVSAVIVNMREKGKVRRIEQIIGKRFSWREVPHGREICEAQLFSLIQRMKTVDVDEKEIGKYVPAIMEKLEGMERDELIKRFVSLEFNTMLDYYRNEKDLSSGEKHTRSRNRDDRPEPSDWEQRSKNRPSPRGVRMFINLGAFDGLTPQRLMGLMNRSGASEVRVGRVDVFTKHSFFDIANQDVETVMACMEGMDFDGRRLRCNPADDAPKGRSFRRAGPQRSEGNTRYQPRGSHRGGRQNPGYPPRNRTGGKSSGGGRSQRPPRSSR